MSKTKPTPNTKVTLQAVADTVGVSRSTVSRALHDSSLVNAAVRKKVQAAAKKLGYRPDSKLNELMVHLRKGRTHIVSETIGIVMSTGRENYLKNMLGVLGPLIQGVERQAQSQGFGTDIFHLEDYDGDADRLNRVLQSRGIRGLILYAIHPPHAGLALDWSRLSPVASGYSLSSPGIHRVCHYHLHGVRMAHQKLRELGYRNIAISMDTINDANTDRGYLAGYYAEHFRSSNSLPKPLVYDRLTKSIFSKWLLKTRPDAIIMPGLGLDHLEMLESLGYNVPGDIGLATLHVRKGNFHFSGINQRSAIIGETVVNLVTGMIFRNEKGIPDKPITLQVEGEWNAGSTCRNLLES